MPVRLTLDGRLCAAELVTEALIIAVEVGVKVEVEVVVLLISKSAYEHGNDE